MTRFMAIALLAACTSVPEDAVDDDVDLGDLDDLDEMDGKADGVSDWTVVGNGIAYQHVNAGKAIVIAYGGYTARISHSAAWASELVDAKLGALGVGHIYAVKGPADAAYAGREIGNSKLRAHLATFDDATSTIYVVAHSSGSFVAHELFEQLHATANAAVLARTAYANLDGGGSGLTAAIVEQLGHAAFVFARDPAKGLSRNAGSAMSLASTYAPHATLYEVTVAETGCNVGAGWCLHDVVITHRPHNPASFDVARDYTDFAGRPVTTAYLDGIE